MTSTEQNEEFVGKAPEKFSLATAKASADIVVQSDEAAKTIAPPVSDSQERILRKEAEAYINELSKLDHKSPEFSKKIQEISNKANSDIAASTDFSNSAKSILDRKTTSVAGAKRAGNEGQKVVSTELANLRNLVEDFSPHGKHLSGTRKILGVIPMGKNIERYVKRFDTAEDQLEAISASLFHGRDELLRDNAELYTQEEKLWNAMGKLNEAAFYLQALDDATVKRMEEIKASGDMEEYKVMDNDILNPIRQRNQDVTTQMAVTAQAYLSMGLIRNNNVEIVKGVERAQNTTVVALSTAVRVATSLAGSEDALRQLEATKATTEKLILENSKRLKDNVARTHKLATETTIDVNVLRQAFTDTFATMDAIDVAKSEANIKMDAAKNALIEQLERTKPYLERSRNESLGFDNGASRGQISS
jgi:uncharacterized protein YaaN involved in tellurite resistance